MAQRILLNLAGEPQYVLNTRELRKEIPGADNQQIRYRVQRLEKAGCVRTWFPEDAEDNDPKNVSLEKVGHRVIDTRELDSDPPEESTEARVEDLENEIEELWGAISDILQGFEQLNEAYEQQQARLKGQQEMRGGLDKLESLSGSVNELEQRVSSMEEFRRDLAKEVGKQETQDGGEDNRCDENDTEQSDIGDAENEEELSTK